MIDENFEYFLEKMGTVMDKLYVPPSSIDRYCGKLPDQLLSYWNDHGWCGYGSGLFWTVNPQEYEPVLEAWIGETQFMEQDAYHIIARGAFGKLYLWGEKTGHSLTISAPGSYCVPRFSKSLNTDMNFKMQLFFGGMSRDGGNFDGMFEAAYKKLGLLKHDEMYGFVPALALGGASSIEHLQKVKAVQHLTILAQLAPLNVITSPPF